MLISFIRAAILYLIIIVMLRLVGKKQIGQLEPSELVLSLIIADLAAVPMSDIGIPLLYGIVPIVSVYACEKIISYIVFKGQKAESIIIGNPSILVKNGIIQEDELRKCDFTVNDLLEQLRLKNCFELKDVAFAVLETCGQLSIIPTQDPNNQSFNYQLPLSLVIDGEVCLDNLFSRGYDIAWLKNILSTHQLSIDKLFFAYLDKNDVFHFQVKEVTKNAK